MNKTFPTTSTFQLSDVIVKKKEIFILFLYLYFLKEEKMIVLKAAPEFVSKLIAKFMQI